MPKNASVAWRLFDVYQMNDETWTREGQTIQFRSQQAWESRLRWELEKAEYQVEVIGEGWVFWYGKWRKVLFREMRHLPRF